MKLPLLGDLLKYLGPIPTIFVSIGLPTIGLGLGLSSPLLILSGVSVILLAFTCYFGGQGFLWVCHWRRDEYCSDHDYDERRHLHIGEDAPAFVLCFGALVASVYLVLFLVLTGRWPWTPTN
jgi:hypothetical protein